jgi:hypothetical protein
MEQQRHQTGKAVLVSKSFYLMVIDTAFMLFCLYVCRTEIKIILLLYNGEKNLV